MGCVGYLRVKPTSRWVDERQVAEGINKSSPLVSELCLPD
jgi:hypothetical protein